MDILLTSEEIEAIPVTNWGGNVDDLNIAKAQVKKVAEHIKNLPTDGQDKWYWYHQGLAKMLLEGIE